MESNFLVLMKEDFTSFANKISNYDNITQEEFDEKYEIVNNLFNSIIDTYTDLRLSDEYETFPKKYREHICNMKAYLMEFKARSDNKDKNLSYIVYSSQIEKIGQSLDGMLQSS